MNDIAKALLNIALGAQWTLRGDTYADLEWHDEVIPKPTEEELNAAIANLSVIESEKEKAKADAKAAEDELVEIINKNQNPVNISRDEQRAGFGLTFDGNSVSNKKTILTSVTSEKENKEDLTNQFYNHKSVDFLQKQKQVQLEKMK